MRAPRMTIFETAANLELWPRILPHYRYIRYLERAPELDDAERNEEQQRQCECHLDQGRSPIVPSPTHPLRSHRAILSLDQCRHDDAHGNRRRVCEAVITPRVADFVDPGTP